ncbi:hypothetical protein AB0I22_38200 [Streptomyces sp. NPDC050610]|uniref:hypothetical protein n=1 Tax=Streptomyces sp. NPDC050610 TaxID=3157097 RepID=UPI003413FBFB
MAELEAKLLEIRDVSIASRVCMSRAPHGYYGDPARRTSIADSVDQAGERLLLEMAEEHAAEKQAEAGVPGRSRRPKSVRGGTADEVRLLEIGYMTVHEVAVAAWDSDLGVSSMAELEEMIRSEHALRMAAYEQRSSWTGPLTQRVCRPAVELKNPGPDGSRDINGEL